MSKTQAKCPLTSAELRRLAELSNSNPLVLGREANLEYWELSKAIDSRNGYDTEHVLARLAADLMDENATLRRERDEAEAAIVRNTSRQDRKDGSFFYYIELETSYPGEDDFEAIHRAHERARSLDTAPTQGANSPAEITPPTHPANE